MAGKSSFRGCFIIFLILILPSMALASGNWTWVRTDPSPGNWSSGSNWSGGSGIYPDDPDETAIFNNPSGVGGPIQNLSMSNGLGRLIFNYSGWTVYVQDPLKINSISNYSYNAIYSYGTGTNLIYPAIEFLAGSGQNIYTGTGSTLAIAGGFTGSYAPTISSVNPTSTDTGAVRLQAASDVSGVFYIRQGTLLVAANNALGSSASTVNIGGDEYVANNANARLLTDAANVTVTKNIAVRTYTDHEVNATLGGQQTTGSSSFTGTISLGRTTSFTAASGGPVSFTNTISGNGGVTKIGAGTVTFSGTGSYLGTTTVSQGTLAFGANNVLGSGPLTVNGATLSMGSYTDSVGTVTLENSGQITGNGTLTSTGNFEMKSGSVSVNLAGTSANLYKTTAGTVTLSGTGTYGGSTIISQGTLACGASNVLGPGLLDVNGGTLSLGSNTDSVGAIWISCRHGLQFAEDRNRPTHAYGNEHI